VDFPVSAALLLPDATAANLIGENYLVQTIKGRDFRVSAGAFCYPNLAAAEILIETVLDYASLGGSEKVLELHSGSALLTAFLADEATELIGVEWRADAVADAVVNLHSHENIALYEGPLEEIVPRLDFMPDVIVAEPAAEGLSPEVIDALGGMTAKRLVYVSQDVATLARDCKRLTGQGYRLAEVQPIDMVPQTFQVYCVALFHHRA
jgi:23S rRNA (uracil1939-C5)-methyltransferase